MESLPGPAWSLILSCLAPSDLTTLLGVARSTRTAALTNCRRLPRLSVQLGDEKAARMLLVRAQEAEFHLHLVPVDASALENTEMAVQLLRDIPERCRKNVLMLTLQGLHLDSLVPNQVVQWLPKLKDLALRWCQFQGDSGFRSQCVLDRVPQTWRMSFNYVTFGQQVVVQEQSESLLPGMQQQKYACVRSTRSVVHATPDVDQQQQIHQSNLSPAQLLLRGQVERLPTSLPPLALRSISGQDTSARMLHDLPVLAAQMTSLKLLDVWDFQDRVQYPTLIRLIGSHLTQLRVLDTGSLYWPMRQAETECLLGLPCLTHLTVSCFELDNSLTDRLCRWRALTLTCWDGYVHVPSLAHLPLHSLREPLLLTGGPLGESSRIPSDGGISLCLGPDCRAWNDPRRISVSLLRQATHNVLAHTGIRWRGVQRVLAWNGGPSHDPIWALAVEAVIPLLTGCQAQLELAQMRVGWPLLESLRTYLSPTLTELTLFDCDLGLGVALNFVPSLPHLQRLTLTADQHTPPPEDDVWTDLIKSCAQREPRRPPLMLVVAQGWGAVAAKVMAGRRPRPEGVELRVIATFCRITPRGVFPFQIQDFEALDEFAAAEAE